MERTTPALRGVPAPLRISLLYACFGVAWIVAGDLALWLRGGVTAAGLLLELGKGLVFVLASALFLHILIRREVERRQKAAAQLESVLETTPVGIAAVAADGTLTRWNAAASTILGWSENEVVGRTPEDLGLGLAGAADAGGVYDLTVPHRDGRSVELRLFTKRDEGARVIAFRDRRPQIAYEMALRRAHKLEAVGRLAGGVAHEFNNILTTVIGHSLLLTDELDPADARREHADEVRRSAERAAALTRQLLVFSGKHVSHSAPLDLSAMLRELRNVLARVAGDDITLEYRLADDVWPVRCDPAQLHQLLLNLVVNAGEAITGAGTITIETENVTVAQPTGPDPVPAGEYARLRVSDTGSGMSAETLAHLFEPFYTTKTQGTGLGLAAVYGIVLQCEGYIRVHSEPGSGSRFDVYLPRAGEVVETPVADVRPTARAAALLVVEDDDAVRDLTCRVLRRHGHHVLSARNGHEALEVLEQGSEVRLVIADVVMPGMNGIELGSHIRSRWPGLQVLYTSGFVGGADEEGEIEPGPNFLQKPSRPDELIARVDQLLVQLETHSA